MWAAEASTMRAISAPALGYVRWVALRRVALAARKASRLSLVPPNPPPPLCFGEPFRVSVSGPRKLAAPGTNFLQKLITTKKFWSSLMLVWRRWRPLCPVGGRCRWQRPYGPGTRWMVCWIRTSLRWQSDRLPSAAQMSPAGSGGGCHHPCWTPRCHPGRVRRCPRRQWSGLWTAGRCCPLGWNDFELFKENEGPRPFDGCQIRF